ncbi:MAG: DUF4340 domain-containing protein [Magnetococcales bacterium]|nr:DUF4340 domain-containing protein [Magnetococcales bacterium]
MSDTPPMAKVWKVNLVLLLIVLGGAATLWWLDAQEGQRVEADKASKRITHHFSVQESSGPKAVVRVEWQYPSLGKEPQGAGRVTIVPQETAPEGKGAPPGRWRITAPAAMQSNDGAVARLLGILGENYDRKVAESGADPAPYGLQSPAAVLTVHNGAGESLQLSVGQSAPASKKHYLQVGAQGPVVLVPAQAVSGLLQSLNDVREKRLFANPAGRLVQRIHRESPSGQTTLVREADKPWQLLAPLKDLASESRVEAWLNALLQISGSGFAPVSAEGAFKLVTPDWNLVLEGASGEKERVRIQRQEKRLLAWREGEVDALVLDSTQAEELDKSAMELIALRPLPLPQTPAKLQVTHQGKTLTATKEGGQWPKPVWNGVEDILTREAWRGVSPKPHGDAWLTVIVFQDNEQRVIPFWKEGGSVVLAPPNRPLELELTQYQVKAFEETIKALLAEE